MATVAALIVTLRSLAQDADVSKVIFGENICADPATPADGVNTHFRLRSAPVVSGSVYISTVGGSYRSQTGFTVDLPTGIVTFTVAPAANAQMVADYAFYWFADAQHTEFLNQAGDNLQLGQNPLDLTTVVIGLQPALIQYALANLWRARASQYAEKYASSGGEAGESVQTVAEAYIKLARAADKRGDELRDGYYSKQGQKLDVSYASPRTYPAPGFDPITPRR